MVLFWLCLCAVRSSVFRRTERFRYIQACKAVTTFFFFFRRSDTYLTNKRLFTIIIFFLSLFVITLAYSTSYVLNRFDNYERAGDSLYCYEVIKTKHCLKYMENIKFCSRTPKKYIMLEDIIIIFNGTQKKRVKFHGIINLTVNRKIILTVNC